MNNLSLLSILNSILNSNSKDDDDDDNNNMEGHQHHDHNMMMMGMGSSMNDDHTSDDDNNNVFCKGMGMVMYMEGFQWSLLKTDTTPHSCLNFYFPSWTLDTRTKFIGAMICIIIMGIVTEGIGRLKHDITKRARKISATSSRSTNTRTIQTRLWYIQTLLQGCSVLMAYVLMLIVMTYSLEMLCCVILGLVIGYFIFGGDLYNHSSSPCCQFLEDEDNDEDENENVTATLMRALLSTTTTTDEDGDHQENNDDDDEENNDNAGYMSPNLSSRTTTTATGGVESSCCSGNNNNNSQPTTSSL